MPMDNEARKGAHLNMTFGVKPGAPAARNSDDMPFRLVIIGDFGGSGDGRVTDISGEDIASLLGSFGAVATLEVPNHLGSMPPALAIRLPIASLRDLDPKKIASRVPEIAKAEHLAAAFGRGATGEFEALAADPTLDHVVSILRRSVPARPAAYAQPTVPTSPPEENSLDLLLDLVDIPGASPKPAAEAAVSAFLSSVTQPRPAASSKKADIGAITGQQATEIVNHPQWLAIEAAWRSLKLIMTARGSRHATRLVLCDTARDTVADVLQRPAFAEALAEEPAITAILVIGAFSRSDRDLNLLDRVAAAAERLAAPVIVSLDPHFLGEPPEKIARMDNPAALLDAAGYAAWRGLRGRAESQWLFAAWNDVVLRPAEEAAPTLWGEAGTVLGAQILRSLASCGWPTEILGVETALGGLEVMEVELPGGRRSAIPLRTAIRIDAARDLADHGIACAVCRIDADQAWFSRAPSLLDYGSVSKTDRAAMEGFVSLPFRFVSTHFETLLREHATTIRGLPDDQAAAAMTRFLEDVLLPTGSGAAAHVAPGQADGDGRTLDVTIRLGQAVMGGFSFSFDIAV